MPDILSIRRRVQGPHSARKSTKKLTSSFSVRSGAAGRREEAGKKKRSEKKKFSTTKKTGAPGLVVPGEGWVNTVRSGSCRGGFGGSSAGAGEEDERLLWEDASLRLSSEAEKVPSYRGCRSNGLKYEGNSYIIGGKFPRKGAR